MIKIKKLIKENKKVILLSTLGLTLFIVLIPIAVNFLIMSWTTNLTFSTSEAWLGLWGALISAILGGIISGGLTLGGVILTINYQEEKHKENERKAFLKNYPTMNGKIDAIQAEELDVLRALKIYMNNKNEENFESNQYLHELRLLLEQRRKRFGDIQRYSSEFDFDLYNVIRLNYVMNLETLYHQLQSEISLLNIEDLRLEGIEKELTDCFDAVMNTRTELARKYSQFKD